MSCVWWNMLLKASAVTQRWTSLDHLFLSLSRSLSLRHMAEACFTVSRPHPPRHLWDGSCRGTARRRLAESSAASTLEHAVWVGICCGCREKKGAKP